MKRKGFTLVELLVVISIIALLMAILMPVLSKVKAMANRMMCGTKLAGIGKGMVLYASDYEDEYPIAGGMGAIWGTGGEIANWDSPDIPPWVGATPFDTTITASFFLLIKYTDMTTRQFVCRGDTGTTDFELSDCTAVPLVDEISEAWDFGDLTASGPGPGLSCSYSYHMPYTISGGAATGESFPITPQSSPTCPLAGDRNPYMDRNAQHYVGGTTDEPAPDWEGSPGHYVDRFKTGNASPHQRDGQNVLFNDLHVTFERYPNVGVNNDNIWLYWNVLPADVTPRDRELDGTPPGLAPGRDAPVSENDAFLVNEVN